MGARARWHRGGAAPTTWYRVGATCHAEGDTLEESCAMRAVQHDVSNANGDSGPLASALLMCFPRSWASAVAMVAAQEAAEGAGLDCGVASLTGGPGAAMVPHQVVARSGEQLDEPWCFLQPHGLGLARPLRIHSERVGDNEAALSEPSLCPRLSPLGFGVWRD